MPETLRLKIHINPPDPSQNDVESNKSQDGESEDPKASR
jgi:hypothetical protein